jgi:hypothetical protein
MSKTIKKGIFDNLELKFDYLKKEEYKVPITAAIDESFDKGFALGEKRSEMEKWKGLAEAATRNFNAEQERHNILKEKVYKLKKVLEDMQKSVGEIKI